MDPLWVISRQIFNYLREQSQQTFFFEPEFVELKNSELQACNVKEKGVVLHKDFFEIFEILEHPRQSIHNFLFSEIRRVVIVL